MATYYVRTDGDNANTGTGYETANAWLTIAKAVSMVAATDIVYIAPGIYRESLTIATSGTAGNTIQWIGDKEGQYFIDLSPGPVRITGCDSDEYAISATVININAKNYNVFRNLVIDGTLSSTASGGAVIGGGTATQLHNSIVSSGYIAVDSTSLKTTLYNCICSGGTISINNCICYNTIAYASRSGYYNCTGYNCISIGGSWAYNQGTYTNCTCLFASIGFGYFVSVKNCVAYACGNGFNANGDAQIIKGKAINCYVGAVGSSGNKLYVGSLKYSQCSTSAAAADTFGTPIETTYEGFNDISKLLKIATALKFDIYGIDWSTDLNDFSATGADYTRRFLNTDYINIGTYNGKNLYQTNNPLIGLLFYSATLVPNQWIIQLNTTTTPNESESNYVKLDNTTPIGTYTNVGTWGGTIIVTAASVIFDNDYDILHHPRRLNNGILDCGAFSHSDMELDFTNHKTFAPCMKATLAGFKRIVIPVQGGIEKTVSVWTKWVSGGGSLPPQLLVSSTEDILTTNPAIATAIGDGTAYEQLSLTFTPKASGICFVEFYARNNNAGSYVYFSDIQI